MSEASVHESLLSRQPILNSQEDLVGYELTLQPVQGEEDNARAATLVCAAYAELGVRSALGQATAFLPVDLDFLHGDANEVIPELCRRTDWRTTRAVMFLAHPGSTHITGTVLPVDAGATARFTG